MRKYEVCIIGSLSDSVKYLGGQTVKTKILVEELRKNKNFEIVVTETSMRDTAKFKLLWLSIKNILKSDVIILLVYSNGWKVYLPMLYLAKRIFKKRIFHDVIGGNLNEHVQKYHSYVRFLNSFDENWVEFPLLKNRLEDLGVNNCFVIPNFKRLNTGAAKSLPSEIGMRSFCMFSRVIKEKGILLAIEAIKLYNLCHEEKVILNIWGPVDAGFKEEFEQALGENDSSVFYKGIVTSYDKSVETLTDHLALLFPTFFVGEGFPGTIFDAFASGVPVIASDWYANREIVDSYKTGIVFPVDEIKTLYDAIVWAMENRGKMIEMRKNCLDFSVKNGPDACMKIINDKIMEAIK